jgi:hypothetical protein
MLSIGGYGTLRIYKETATTVLELETVTCDVCGIEVSVEDDPYKAQEFLHIKELYGYGSEHFGDMTEMEIDMCERCTWLKLRQHCRMRDTHTVFAPMEDVDNTAE